MKVGDSAAAVDSQIRRRAKDESTRGVKHIIRQPLDPGQGVAGFIVLSSRDPDNSLKVLVGTMMRMPRGLLNEFIRQGMTQTIGLRSTGGLASRLDFVFPGWVDPANVENIFHLVGVGQESGLSYGIDGRQWKVSAAKLVLATGGERY